MTESRSKKPKHSFNLRSLRLSLKYRPEILELILRLKLRLSQKQIMIEKLRCGIIEMVNENRYEDVSSVKELVDSGTNTDIIVASTATANDKDQPKQTEPDDTSKSEEKEPDNSKSIETKDQITQTEEIIKKKKQKDPKEVIAELNTSKSEEKEPVNSKSIETKDQMTQTEEIIKKKKQKDQKEVIAEEKPEDSGWNINDNKETKSIAEQVAEVAQDAMKESGMVYVESAGMYYDYKTGYYYNSELGLYYHTDTECYYYYSEDKKTFVFHSYPDRSSSNAALLAHEKRKARKHKMDKEADGKEEIKKPKRKKNHTKKVKTDSSEDKTTKDETTEVNEKIEENDETEASVNEEDKKEESEAKTAVPEELEDGECSDTSTENSDDEDEDKKSNISTSTASDDEAIAKHHPPCMRVIVRETSLPKLRVGNLFIVTKDGGTVGREGEQHTILLRDNNVSRNHLDIQFDPSRNLYTATDLGSKNGTVLNGTRMSESQVMSKPMEIVHGSTIQLGETKLLCHIHPGNDTCGHCEPGLLMEAIEKEKKVAYTRTCNVQKQHQLELARLKNKYAPKPLAIEETAYNDRAQARRETVGSSHHSEKTQITDVNTSITPENKGFKLLEKMGWNKGEGLGKVNQGETEPVPLISNEGKAGLGAGRVPPAPLVKNSLGQATMRLANRTKLLKPPAKAFQNTLDDDEEELE